MKITQQVEGGVLEDSITYRNSYATGISVKLTFMGGDTVSFNAGREALAELITKLNTELEKVES